MSDRDIPSFDGNSDYAKYKRDVELWCRYTEMASDKRGAALVRKLCNRPREIADTISLDVLFQEESKTRKSGAQVLIELLDEHYLKSDIDTVFCRLVDFFNTQRTDSVRILDYTSKFSSLARQLQADGVQLSGSMLSLLAIHHANLTQDQRSMIFTLLLNKSSIDSLDLEFTLKSLRQLFTDTSTENPSKKQIALNAESDEQNNYGKNFSKGKGKGKSSGRGNQYNSHSQSKGNYGHSGYHHNSGGYGYGKNSGYGTKGRGKGYYYRDQYQNQGNWKGGKSKSWYGENSSESTVEKSKSSDKQIEHTNFAFVESSLLSSQFAASAILDIGCSFNMCSEKWLTSFESHTGKTYPRIYETKHFVFGNSTENTCPYKVTIPITILDNNFNITVAVLTEGSIPLLISKDTLKYLGATLDMVNDRLLSEKFDFVIELTTAKYGGHYLFPLLDLNATRLSSSNSNSHRSRFSSDTPFMVDEFSPGDAGCLHCLDCDVVALSEFSTDKSCMVEEISPGTADCSEFSFAMTHGINDKKQLMRLHEKLGHPSSQRLWDLLQRHKDATNATRDLIFSLECTRCSSLESKKPNSKPKISMFLSTRPNEIAHMDLTEINIHDKKYTLCHIIDSFSKVSHAKFVSTKKAEESLSILMDYSTKLGSNPTKIFTDCGSEFNNRLFHDYCNYFDIQHVTTSSYHAHQNGICERRHFTIKQVFFALYEELKSALPNMTTLEFVLAYTIMVINSLPIQSHKFSPIEIAYGIRPDVLISPEYATPGKGNELEFYHNFVGDRIKLMNQIRDIVLSTLTTTMVSRALHQRTDKTEEPFYWGEKVYYRKPPQGGIGKHVMYGPFLVVGNIGREYWLQQGSNAINIPGYRIHRSCNIDSIPSDKIVNVCNDCGMEYTDSEGHKLFCQGKEQANAVDVTHLEVSPAEISENEKLWNESKLKELLSWQQNGVLSNLILNYTPILIWLIRDMSILGN